MKPTQLWQTCLMSINLDPIALLVYKAPDSVRRAKPMTQDRSRAELLKFLDYLGEKGLMSPVTARSRKASANRVLSILSDEESDDVTKLDLDEIMTRFS